MRCKNKSLISSITVYANRRIVIKIKYSDKEKFDIVCIYAECHKNAVQTKRLYSEKLPNRNKTIRLYFSKY